MKHFASKTSLLAMTMFVSLGLASCGSTYEDMHIDAGVYTVKDGKNTFTLTQIDYRPDFHCVMQLNIQEDQFYLSDIKDEARVINFTVQEEYRASVVSEVARRPFPEYRDQKLEFRSYANPFADGKNDDWALSFRYRSHRFIFHLGIPSAL